MRLLMLHKKARFYLYTMYTVFSKVLFIGRFCINFPAIFVTTAKSQKSSFFNINVHAPKARLCHFSGFAPPQKTQKRQQAGAARAQKTFPRSSGLSKKYCAPGMFKATKTSGIRSGGVRRKDLARRGKWPRTASSRSGRTSEARTGHRPALSQEAACSVRRCHQRRSHPAIRGR